MNKELQSIIGLIDANFETLQKNFNVKKIGIFGSTARGESTKNSDIDIIVEFKEPIGFFDFVKLEAFLSKKLFKKVDLATKRALKPEIKKEILKEIVYA